MGPVPRVAVLLLVGLYFACQPVRTDSRSEIEDASAALALLTELRDYSAYPVPSLDDRDLQQLRSGEPIARIETAGDADTSRLGVHGIAIVDAPRALVWLALLGATKERDPRFTRTTLADGEDGSYTRYQHIDLPWPMRDRQWLISSQKNPWLAAASDGLIWQHHWNLVPNGPARMDDALASGIDGPTRTRLDKSIWLPANLGAWSAIPVGNRATLVVAYYSVDMGGRFPRKLVQKMTRRELRRGLERLTLLSEQVPARYVGAPWIHDGFGQLLDRDDVRVALLQWEKGGTAAAFAGK